jgi:NAD(P)-dependent dehydrogenase (short-subunit alcohol dehydrogenase family)
MTPLARNDLGGRTTAEQALRGLSLSGQTAIVTGAGSGIGTETARVLALAGARVIMAVRNVPAAEAVAARLRPGVPAGALEVRPLDLASFASVRAFAAAFTEPRLHLLVANAGVMAPPLGQTADGFETQLGTNHLGHFLLTRLLQGKLQAAGRARVVVVASRAHRRGTGENLLATLETDRAYQRRRYVPMVAYGDSKLANILFTRALARRLAGSDVAAYCLHPGVIHTPLMKHLGVAGAIFGVLGRPFLKTIAQGAATSVFAATAPELTPAHSGIYLADCNEARPFPQALDDQLGERLWSGSERATS